MPWLNIMVRFGPALFVSASRLAIKLSSFLFIVGTLLTDLPLNYHSNIPFIALIFLSFSYIVICNFLPVFVPI